MSVVDTAELFSSFVRDAGGQTDPGALVAEFRRAHPNVPLPPPGFSGARDFVVRGCPELLWKDKGGQADPVSGKRRGVLRYVGPGADSANTGKRKRDDDGWETADEGGPETDEGRIGTLLDDGMTRRIVVAVDQTLDERHVFDDGLGGPGADGTTGQAVMPLQWRGQRQDKRNRRKMGVVPKALLLPDLPLVDDVVDSVRVDFPASPPADFDEFLAILPSPIADHLRSGPSEHRDGFVELVLDLGRPPQLHYQPPGSQSLATASLPLPPADRSLLDSIRLPFASDNRAGIPGTLHRVSRRPNRSGQAIGYTLRAGRTAGSLHALITPELDAGLSVLLIGRPGSGKTTLLRGCAAHLARTKRTEIVDTSNEIAGDADVPHPSVGGARRMMVPDRRQQHRTMLEAVSNHTPQALIVDEVQTAEEALAARDIKERGVQLLASCHGGGIGDVLAGPVLGRLLGGSHAVVQSGEEPKERGIKGRAEHTPGRTVRERVGEPAFDVVVEIRRQGCVVVIDPARDAVDHLLAGRPFEVEVRRMGSGGEVEGKRALMNWTRTQVGDGGVAMLD
ncbi:hypothetical protein DFJ74DRAFT_714434 [Hyaloraphidium curvatum]|nr:hypothetical protein DFJ74DRAFT_714434 [Hyaloraphidium curvatum]